ncbi:MAG TPA: tRNA (guanosine(37)-N1)-methyltransferase TrmD, partial [Candidatus Paceibacterota bacterium]|nr:tRNA (guanosine(37)-N1)-methyltransferase TrmD [Candidatus Paceibacterota bacterium]
MRFDIITIFPNIFSSYLKESFLKRAQEKKLISIKAHDLRDYSIDRHRKVDDRPFGGGPGMVLKVEPIYKAVNELVSSKDRKLVSRSKTRVILFSLRGKRLDAKEAKRLAKYDRLILICGRYEGVDERVAEHVVDEEISIGDYVLSGGELPALVLMESVCRFIPGFLGKAESLEEINGSFPTYTRPEAFKPKKSKAWKVPEVLLSGDHKKIE